jgi:DNA-binding helix-hairpin-helix protein with protein kinase domain
MGRHPFSGVYTGPGDLPIEKAISAYRFAFSTNGHSRGMRPPPNSVTLAIVPQQLSLMFERAFSEEGTTNGRPTAHEWVGMLDVLRNNLRACPTESIHKFYGGLAGCPWCSLENAAGLLFFVGAVPAANERGAFDLEHLWRRISSIAPPVAAPLPSPSQCIVSPRPLPGKAIAHNHLNIFKRIAAAAIVVGTFVIFPGAIVLTGILACILFAMSFTDSEEKVKRQFALNVAKKRWQEVERQWWHDVGDTKFRARLSELQRLRNDYEKLDRDYGTARQQLHATMRDRQLHRFLDEFYIEGHPIPQIGASRKATLASFGIETAADIQRNKIRSIAGFGAVLTQQLLDWRRELEQKFVFNTTKGVDPADLAALDQRFRQQRRQLEGELLAGPESLNRLRAEVAARVRALLTQVETAARDLAQATADFSVV